MNVEESDIEFEDDVIEFTDEDGNPVELKILSKTKINGVDYFLVTEDKDFSLEEEPEEDDDMRFIYKDGDVQKVGGEPKEVECFLLKVTETGDEEITCEPVEDEDEVEAITGVFAELLEDSDADISL
ncbi:MAG: DUF1292 domain-containing protein [Lachnospiraceae bacterium]|nr:DUF1292 domain-containing protein [Lachnospiraceae bacterium]